MKLVAYIVLILILAICLRLFLFSLTSRKPVETGMKNSQLRVCLKSSNCVCSEWKSYAYIAPLDYSIARDQAWQSIRQVIEETGGAVVMQNNDYLHAQYTSLVFRFIDDVELRLDENHKLIHIRSSSRVGHSDLGTNRRRVESIRARFKQVN